MKPLASSTMRKTSKPSCYTHWGKQLLCICNPPCSRSQRRAPSRKVSDVCKSKRLCHSQALRFLPPRFWRSWSSPVGDDEAATIIVGDPSSTPQDPAADTSSEGSPLTHPSIESASVTCRVIEKSAASKVGVWWPKSLDVPRWQSTMSTD